MFPDVQFDQEDHPVVKMMKDFDYRQGKVFLPGGQAILEVPQGYYYLNQDDAAKVLMEIWDNPDGESLGMIFPAAGLPTDPASWGIVLTWDPAGYVSDEDANTIDFGDLLQGMREDTADENNWRAEQGFPKITLVGWAEEPSYDKATRKLHWAKELNFEGSEANTLNYNLRALGRKGVLQLNFVAGISQLEEIKSALPEVAQMTAFAEGARYADFDPSVDKVAAYGIGGLIAGKVLAKTGFLALALVFLKKFWIVLLLPLAWLWRKIAGKGNAA